MQSETKDRRKTRKDEEEKERKSSLGILETIKIDWGTQFCRSAEERKRSY